MIYVNTDLIQKSIFNLLLAIGEDPTREGLKETPARVARFWEEFTNYDPGNTETTFESIQADQMVVVKGMKVWSLCEHHLLPFYATISIAYITKDKVLGLSKFGRVAQQFAHKLQVQERLVEDIAREIKSLTGTDNVAVHAEGEHLCMTMRGIKLPSKMISSALYGDFRTDPQVRMEFLQLIKED